MKDLLTIIRDALNKAANRREMSGAGSERAVSRGLREVADEIDASRALNANQLKQTGMPTYTQTVILPAEAGFHIGNLVNKLMGERDAAIRSSNGAIKEAQNLRGQLNVASNALADARRMADEARSKAQDAEACNARQQKMLEQIGDALAAEKRQQGAELVYTNITIMDAIRTLREAAETAHDQLDKHADRAEAATIEARDHKQNAERLQWELTNATARAERAEKALAETVHATGAVFDFADMESNEPLHHYVARQVERIREGLRTALIPLGILTKYSGRFSPEPGQMERLQALARSKS